MVFITSILKPSIPRRISSLMRFATTFKTEFSSKLRRGNITKQKPGTRTIINIQEFSSEAETKYFKLPEGVKDITKRETEGKGATKK